MSLADRLNENYPARQATARGRPKHPEGWTPHVEEHGDTAVAISQPMSDPDPDEASLIEGWGFDPAIWQIVGPINCRRWQANLGEGQVEWLYYYKANLERRGRHGHDVDYDALLKLASRARPRRTPTVTGDGGATFVVCVADWQAGQLRGGGPTALVERVHNLRASVEDRYRTLTKSGVQFDGIALLCLGDLVEACDGHYPMQAANTADMREQTRLVRRLLYGLVDTAAKLAPQVTLAAVPGNHGEKRKDGKAYTSWSDNLDVEIPEQVGDILSANEDRFGHVKVALPTGSDLTLTLDLSGTVVGMAHGHQFRGGGSIQQKVDRWWAHKSKHRHLIGDADMLLSGHFHHLQVWEEGTHDGGTKTWIQCPSLDGGSDWFEHQGGAPTRQGTLTFVASGGTWDRIEVLR